MKVYTLASLAMAGLVAANDVLYSQRLAKRDPNAPEPFKAKFYHVNDIHSHLDLFAKSGLDCKNPEYGCYGGYSRIKHVLDTARAEDEDALVFDAGDEFQGTLFYAHYKTAKISETLNRVGFDAMTLGNHEWDGGDVELGEFLTNLEFPVLSANIDSADPNINATVRPYVIFEKQQIAVIGVTTQDTDVLSSPDNTIFLDVVSTVQRTIEDIQATTNIKRIVALTHIGIDQDIKLAEATRGLSLIMGGHTHTLLGDMPEAEGKYPTIAHDAEGNEVFVVTAHCWGDYVGKIEVAFDEDGHALSYEGAPIPITDKTPFDAELQADIDEWRKGFQDYASVVVGSAATDLDQDKCRKEECVLGNAVADAMLEYVMRNSKSEISKDDEKRYFTMVNSAGIRATIESGDVTLNDVLTALPFRSMVVEAEFDGKTLWDTFEGSVSRRNIVNGQPITSFFQVSRGVEIIYNPTMPAGSRLISVKINGEQLNPDETYRMVAVDFMLKGGDNMLLLNNANKKASYKEVDVVFLDYLKRWSPIKAEIDGRIVKFDPSSSSTSEAASSTNSDSNNKAVSYTGGYVASTGALPTHTAVSTGTFAKTTTGYAKSTKLPLVTAAAAGSHLKTPGKRHKEPRSSFLSGSDSHSDSDDENESWKSAKARKTKTTKAYPVASGSPVQPYGNHTVPATLLTATAGRPSTTSLANSMPGTGSPIRPLGASTDAHSTALPTFTSVPDIDIVYVTSQLTHTVVVTVDCTSTTATTGANGMVTPGKCEPVVSTSFYVADVTTTVPKPTGAYVGVPAGPGASSLVPGAAATHGASNSGSGSGSGSGSSAGSNAAPAGPANPNTVSTYTGMAHSAIPTTLPASFSSAVAPAGPNTPGTSSKSNPASSDVPVVTAAATTMAASFSAVVVALAAALLL
ncbi:Apyrase [Ceratocystis platani]|uniref:Apyrase n=1 Tax=Ceratocystis fimbriata f. sp. platani TaxID=88771 RepID=A0A0F8BQ76_CERFI|nr:Apyrase [Ceratocystis platani]